MLKRPLPGLSRRLIGIAFVLALTSSGSYTAWAAQSGMQDKGTRILVNAKLTVTSSTDIWVGFTEYLVDPGEALPLPYNSPYDARCTPSLLEEPEQSSARDNQKASGTPIPVTGQIFLECEIIHNGEVVSTQSLFALDGQLATIEADDHDQVFHFKLEVNASTSEERIAAAKAAEELRRNLAE